MNYKSFIDTYLNIINQAANSGLTPPALIQKIFSDIKKQNFNKSFILVYQNKDIYRFCPQKYKLLFKDPLFNIGKQIDYLIFLNLKIYNSQQKLQEYSNHINDLITKINNKQILQLNKHTIFSQYLNFLESQINQNQLVQAFNKLPENIAQPIKYNYIHKFLPTLKIDKRLSLLNTLNFIKNDITKIINLISNIEGLTVHQPFSNCLMISINNKFFNSRNLDRIYTIINHELDHYFFYRLHTDHQPNNHIKASQSTQDMLKYITDKTQINSRITDLCNLFNNKIIPLEYKNALQSLLSFLNNNFKKFNQIDNVIEYNKSSYQWLKNINSGEKDTLYAALIYFHKQNLKEYIIGRLQKQFNVFNKKFNNAKKIYKYNQSLKRKFK